MTLTLPCSYFSPILALSLYADPRVDVSIAACENYQKRSSRNRCKLLASAGVEVLSVPLVKGKNASTPIQMVKIAKDMAWEKQHLKALLYYYQNAPYYEYYIEHIDQLLSKDYEYLFELNIDTLRLLKQLMHLSFDIEMTKTYTPNHSHILEEYTEQKSIKPILQYHQVYDSKLGFTDGLSGLDLLFNLGPESIAILKPLADDFMEWYRHNYNN